MKEQYLKEVNIIDKNEEEKNRELLKTIWKTKKILAQAHQNFEYAEKELIDYYSYNIKANQSKLNYLIKQAKNKGLLMEATMQKKIEDNDEI